MSKGRHARRKSDSAGAVAYGAATLVLVGAVSLSGTPATADTDPTTTSDLPVIRQVENEDEIAAARALRAGQTSFDRGLERKAAELLDPPEPAVIPEPEPEPVPPGKTVAPDEEVEEAPVQEPDPEGEGGEVEGSAPVLDGLSDLRAGVIAFAYDQVGEPYVYGSEGPDSWDCSGLTQAAFASVGLSIPRSSDAQRGMGWGAGISDLQAGDLVGWPGHVALYIGDNTIIEAPRPGLSVRVRVLSDWDYNNGVHGIALDYSAL